MSKKTTKKRSAKSVLSAIAIVLVLVIIVGVVAIYSIADSGFVQRNQVAMKSDNYEVSSAMMNYYFNTLYQSYSSSVTSMGLDTAKPLDQQEYTKGTTWYDYFMDMTKSQVRQLLVLAEAAKAEGFKLDDVEKTDSHDHSAKATLDEIETYAKAFGVTLDYYLQATYGKGVNEKVFTECYELSEIASHYSEHMKSQYTFEKADWDKYYEENKDSFNKVDYLTYTFKVEATELDKDATEDDKAAAEAIDKAAAAELKPLSAELAATTTADSFKAYVENYLKTNLYKDKTEEELKKEKIDIAEIVSDCLVEGATNSSESDLNKWLFDEKRNANDTYVVDAKDGLSFTVYMILPAADTEDLGLACIYRDTYKLKDVRFIPFLNSDYKDNAADAKAAADKVLAEYKDDATEANFIELASPEKYGNENYVDGLLEGIDKGAIGEEVDVWLYDSARKKGDCEVIQVEDSGSFLIYYIGDNEVKWEVQADQSLKNDKYTEEYEALEDKYVVKANSKGIGLVSEIVIGSSSSSSSK